MRRLEDAGFAVDPAEPGCAYFETRGVERLYGGLEPALKRALAAVGAGWDARVGAASSGGSRRSRRRTSRARARRSSSRTSGRGSSSRRCRSSLLPLDARRREELEELGVTRLGELAGLPGGAVAERLGPDGRRAWSLARGGSKRRVRGRRPAAELVETLEFPEAVGNELTLRRALGVLLDRLLARPERGGRALRKVALCSTPRRRRLVAADGDAARCRPPIAPACAPRSRRSSPSCRRRSSMLRLELVELAESVGKQLELVRPEGDELRAHLSEGLRQVRASTGSGSVCTVVEVAPWSRLPEQRALLVPRDD